MSEALTPQPMANWPPDPYPRDRRSSAPLPNRGRGGDDPLRLFTARVLRRMAWRHALPWLVRGLAAGLAAAGLILLMAHVVPWAEAPWWALAAFVAPALGGVAAALVTRPALATTLRRADRLLGLRDRLTTAWEYGDREAPILRLQRDDLVARAGRLDLRAGLPLRPPRREGLAPAGGVALLLIALVAPNPQNGVLAARATAHAHIAHAATRINAARRAASAIPPATANALTKADRLRQARIARVLARLQRALAAARTNAQAYKALARAQDALKALSNPHAAAQRAALAALGVALARNAAARQLASVVRSGAPAAIAQAAHKLAAGLAKMSPSDRAGLARALQSAAQSAAADSATSASLQQAATALAQDDRAGAQAALAQAGQQAASNAARGAQQDALDKANAALDSARNDVSGLNGDQPSGPSGQASGKSGATTGQAGGGGQGGKGQGAGAQGDQSGQGKGSGGKGQGQGGQGSGQGGKGQGQGNGSGQGSGAGQGQGPGSGSGNGSGNGAGVGSGTGGGGRGGNGNGGANGNRGDRVYVPGPQGSGRSTTTKGTDAQPSGGSYQPLTNVLPSYERNARDELNNGSVPAADRSLVSKYFDQLHHGK